MSRPWGRERVAAWWTVAPPGGVPLPGIFLRLDDVDAWVDRRPGVWWRVQFWFGETVSRRFMVRSRPAWARVPNEVAKWRPLKAGGRKKGGGDGGIV